MQMTTESEKQRVDISKYGSNKETPLSTGKLWDLFTRNASSTKAAFGDTGTGSGATGDQPPPPKSEAGSAGTPASTSTDTSEWASKFRMASRDAGSPLTTQLQATKTAPVAQNVELGGLDSSESLDGEQQAIHDTIAARRKKVLAQYDSAVTFYQPGQGKPCGYVYNGKSPLQATDLPTYKSAADGTLAHLQYVVWEELSHEGGISAINAWDTAMLSWGKGFAYGNRKNNKKYGLHSLMKNIWKNTDVQDAFSQYGISYDVNSLFFSVYNLQNRAIETDWNAVALIQSDKSLLSVFIAIAEGTGTDVKNAKPVSQTVTDGQFTSIMTSFSTDRCPSDNALKWNDSLQALVGHISWWVPVAGWNKKTNYSTDNTVQGILTTFGTIMRAKNKNGKEMSSGAHLIEDVATFTNFKAWANRVAANELESKCRNPIPIPKEDFDKSEKDFSEIMFIPAPTATGYYYCYPSVPKGYNADDTVFKFVSSVHFYSMPELLKAFQNHTPVSDLQKILNVYSERIYGTFGGRPRVAINVVLTKRGKNDTKTRQSTIYDDTDYQVLPKDQKDTIDTYLNQKTYKDEIWAYWDSGDHATFYKYVNGRMMSHMISTFGSCSYQTLLAIRNEYATSETYGLRPRVAMDAVLHRGEGYGAQWLLNDMGRITPPLPEDQQDIVKKTLGIVA
jgi:hypothetical protein